jgi:hypothetical protein
LAPAQNNGHINFDNIVKINRKEAVGETPEILNLANTLCKHFLEGKQTRTKFKSKEYSTTKPLDIVHTNLCGPTRRNGLNGEKYFMLLVDEYRRMIAVLFLMKKLEAFEHFKIYKEMVETETEIKIKCLRSTNGGEFTSNEFIDFCSEHGIKIWFSVTNTTKKNEIVERKNKIVLEMAITMLNDSKMKDIFWEYAVHTTFHIQNK